MKVEEYKELFRDLMEDKIHTDDCFCPSCLYQFWRSLPDKKHSKIRKPNFFLGWLIEQTLVVKERRDEEEGKEKFKKDYKRVLGLLNQISPGDFKKLLAGYYSDHSAELWRIAYRHTKVVEEAIERKVNSLELMASSDIKRKIVSDAWIMANKKVFEEHWRLTERIHSFLRDNREASMSQLERRFSYKRAKDLYPCVRFLENKKEIFFDSKNRKIHYVGKGKKLEKVPPIQFLINSF